jgi:hypothetical protein
MPDGIARADRAQNLGNINLRLCVRGEQDQRHARRCHCDRTEHPIFQAKRPKLATHLSDGSDATADVYEFLFFSPDIRVETRRPYSEKEVNACVNLRNGVACKHKKRPGSLLASPSSRVGAHRLALCRAGTGDPYGTDEAHIAGHLLQAARPPGTNSERETLSKHGSTTAAPRSRKIRRQSSISEGKRVFRPQTSLWSRARTETWMKASHVNADARGRLSPPRSSSAVDKIGAARIAETISKDQKAG